MVILRSILVWAALLILASLNRALREFVILPPLGPTAGHIVSTILLSGLILGVAWLTIAWIQPRSPAFAWGLGAMWLTLTLGFEFGAGHYLLHKPWPTLLADYNLARGRIWIAVLVVTLVAPRAGRPGSADSLVRPDSPRRLHPDNR